MPRRYSFLRFPTPHGVLEAVRGISFTAGREKLGIVGESGSGKSVGALSILRLIPNPPGKIIDGEILFEGQDLLKLSDEEIRHIRGRKISMVFQEPMTSLNPVLSIGMQLTETMMLPLSGGMRQRVMIALALSCDPKLIIADEPTTALDVTIQAQILELMKNLTRELGVALIVITHNLGVVARYADRVNVMYAGKIVEMGTAHQIYHEPRHPYTIGLLNSVPRMDLPRGQKLIPIEGSPPDLTRLDDGCSYRPRCRWRVDKCESNYPPLEKVQDLQFSACWRKDDLGKDELQKLRDAS